MAEALYKTVLLFQPENESALLRLGVLAAQQAKLEAAERLLQRSVVNDPALAEGHNNLGLVRHQLDRTADAIACYERAIKLKPDYAIAVDNLGVALLAMGRHDEVVLSHRRALALYPGYPEALNTACAHGKRCSGQAADLPHLDNPLETRRRPAAAITGCAEVMPGGLGA